MVAFAAIEIEEPELTRWLFTDPATGGYLLRHLGLDFATHAHFQVPTAQHFPRAIGPGDIDVLIHGDAFSNATAIEVKRVKVNPATFHTGMPSKVQALRKGVRQANLLAKLGFQRTMLLVVIVVDGRERHGLNFASRGLTANLADTIYQFPDRNRLAPGVGLAFVELVQPVDRPITDAGGVAVELATEPQDSPQSPAALAALVELERTRRTMSGRADR